MKLSHFGQNHPNLVSHSPGKGTVALRYVKKPNMSYANTLQFYLTTTCLTIFLEATYSGLNIHLIFWPYNHYFWLMGLSSICIYFCFQSYFEISYVMLAGIDIQYSKSRENNSTRVLGSNPGLRNFQFRGFCWM